MERSESLDVSAMLDDTNDEVAVVFGGTDTDNGKQYDIKLAEEILSTVTDLAKYTHDNNAALAECEAAAVPKYIGSIEEFAALANDIDICDQLLEEFEKLLGTYQENLSSLNSSVRELQSASRTSKVEIENRKLVANQLQKYGNSLSFPADVAKNLKLAAVTESVFSENLASFERKLAFLSDAKTACPRAYEDQSTSFLELRDYAQRKISACLLGIINKISGTGDFTALRTQQADMLRCATSYQFLYKHVEDKAQEIRDRYTLLAGQFYKDYTSRYATALLKSLVDPSTAPRKVDALGASESRQQHPRFSLFKSAVQQPPVNIFALGDRYKVLSEIENPPMSIPDASKKFPFEVIWRSIVRILLELALSEQPFIEDFFLGEPGVPEAVFQQSCDFALEILANNIAVSWDALSLLSMLCITERYNDVCLRRCVTCMSRFHARAYKLLRHRFSVVMKNHCDSLRNAVVGNFGNLTTPHFITRRYAEFVTSLLTLAGPGTVNEEEAKPWIGANDEVLENLFSAVNSFLPEMNQLIKNFIKKAADTLEVADDQTMFFMNNYSLVLRILQERNINTKETALFAPSLRESMDAYRDSQIQGIVIFKHLVGLVEKVQPILGDDEALVQCSLFKEEYVKKIMVDFQKEWKRDFEVIQSSMISIADFSVAGKVFRQTADRVLECYRVLIDIAKTKFPGIKPSMYLVAETEITYEIRQLGSLFEASTD